MKYTIHWDDAGDETTGTPFTVEASSPQEAFVAACRQIESFGGATARLFEPFHIERLNDDLGRAHFPQFFLPRSERVGWPYGKDR
ncbi:MAG: hypothetical protein ABSC23_13620 [Bryobacteraceae bacterium]|jgi:hypothetical protein